MITLDVQVPREVLEDELEDAEDDDNMDVDMEDGATVFTMDDVSTVSKYTQHETDTVRNILVL